jgi:hypothetical protein
MNSRLIAPFVVLVAAVAALPVNAQVITKFERRNPSPAGQGAAVQLAPTPLKEGAKAYADRTHVFRNVPPALVGAQYILTSNDDKNSPNLELRLTIGQPGVLYLILDNRVGTNLRSQTATPNPVMASMTWMVALRFTDTGMDMAVDENADGSIDNYYSVFSVPVTPGEVVLKAQYDRSVGGPQDRNMYGVAATGGDAKATKPVPASGEQGVAVPALQWTAGTGAAFHNVYLGTSPQLGAADLAGLRLQTPVFPCSQLLTPGVTYYWRVDEIAADGITVTAGDVWSFMAASAVAYEPVPPDGTRWVDPNVTLTWKAGKDAVWHDLYLGADRAAVESGATSALQATFSFTSWKLSALESGTTFFWRVDEVAVDGTRKTGPVWSFTTSPTIEIGDPNLLAWWKMDEGAGATVVDWSGHGRHATFGDPAPTWAKGYFGGALRFAGGGDSVVRADGTFLNGLGALTIAVWIKSDVTYTDKGFLIFETPFGNDDMDMRYDADGITAGGWSVMKMGLTVSEYGLDTTVQLESSNDVQTTEWQHVALVWSSGEALALYLNGQLDSPTFHSAPATGTLTNFSTVILGKGGKDIVDSSWQGLIDDVRLYRVALTEEEIRATMQDDSLRASNPSPADGASIGVGEVVLLTWQAGEKAVSHDVYLGLDQAAVGAANASDTTGVYCGRQGETSFTPVPPLTLGYKYFWRIDEIGSDGAVSRGSLWSFVLAD